MSLKNQAQIDLLSIRVRELELAVVRILRIINDWHHEKEPLEEFDEEEPT